MSTEDEQPIKFIDGKNFSLEDFLIFLNTVFSEVLVPNNHFPSDQLLDEFLNTINERSDVEVKEILRVFFIKNCTFNQDLFYKETYDTIDWKGKIHVNEDYKGLSETQYFKRLMSYKKKSDTVWEGITWILDLLPHFPNEALRGLEAYLLANCQFLPDSYFIAFAHWQAIIRAKYVEARVPQEIFLAFQPRDFEYLISELYNRMGYETKVTKSSYDGGADVHAEKKKVGKRELLLIQCKRYKGNIGVVDVRNLLGIVSASKATKGVLISSSDFTREAKKFSNNNPRIELIGIKQLSQLLNLHLGVLWHVKTDGIIATQKRKNA